MVDEHIQIKCRRKQTESERERERERDRDRDRDRQTDRQTDNTVHGAKVHSVGQTARTPSTTDWTAIACTCTLCKVTLHVRH